MKHLKTLLTVAALAAVNLNATAQTNALAALEHAVVSSSIASATNYAFAPYITYAPKAPQGNRVGGGVLTVYNVNQYVGGALGIDYLGQFSLVSGDLTLQYPTRPLLRVPTIKQTAFASNFWVTPFVLGGLGKPLAGTESGVAVITDVGVQTKFGHFLGGQFGAGACWGEWANAGAYSVKRYHGFINWSKGF